MGTRRRPNVAALVAANERRNETGAARQVRHARAVLDSTKVDLPPIHRRVLLARIANPSSTLTDIAASLGMTKAAYWSSLRRALSGVSR